MRQFQSWWSTTDFKEFEEFGWVIDVTGHGFDLTVRMMLHPECMTFEQCRKGVYELTEKAIKAADERYELLGAELLMVQRRGYPLEPQLELTLGGKKETE